MMIIFKPGQHPDADQLSAFVEQALPAHERNGVLAHLAVCAECRAVVKLVLPAEPVLQPEAPAPEPRRSWFPGSRFSGPRFSGSWISNWAVVLPAAAVAGLAVFIVFVHHRTPVLQQQAEISPAPAAATPPQMQSVSPAHPKAASPAPNPEVATPQRPPAPMPQQETAQPAVGVVAGLSSAAPRTAQSEQQAAPSEQRSVEPAAAGDLNSFVSSANAPVAGRLRPAPQGVAQENELHGAASGGMVGTGKLQAPTGNAQFAPQQNAYQRAAAQTVQVQAEAAPVETQSSQLRGLIARNAGSGLAAQPLPSHFAILSAASQGPIVLAIDTNHTVFVSNDSGQHWKKVQAVWTGRPVKVETVARARMFALSSTGTEATSFAALPQGATAAKMAGTMLSGTVTDRSGAVIPGATVTVTDPQVRLSRTIKSDANGRYLAAGLEPGSYDLDASAPGFKSSHLTSVVVTPANENVANLTLDVGAASETVTVEASPAPVELNAAPEDKVKKAAKGLAPARPSAAARAAAPLFEIVTDTGARWASVDGLTWQPK